jgi:hypothetical protein
VTGEADTPRRTTDWHARRAEDLTDLARSASMAGWWRRGRRRDLFAQAQVHATLGASAVVGADYAERLALAESARYAAEARADSLHDEMGRVEDALRGYGQDLTDGGLTAGEAVERLMARVYNDEDPLPDGPGESERQP